MKFVNNVFVILAAATTVAAFNPTSTSRATNSAFAGQRMLTDRIKSSSSALNMVATDIANGQKAKRTREVSLFLFKRNHLFPVKQTSI